MSQINDLLELLASGVEHKHLGEVGEFIRGNGLQKADLTPAGTPAIHYGQIHTLYGIWTRATKSFTDPEYAKKLRRARTGDLVIATTSEDDEAVGKATAWLGDAEVAVSGDAYIFRHSLDPRYVAYFFQSESFQSQKARHVTGTKVRRISGDSLAKLRIPVPHLEVQREIARVLDQFVDLDAALMEELNSREVQYSHYRQVLLDQIAADSAELSSLGTWIGGITPSKANRAYWNGGETPWLASMDISDGSTNEIRGRVTARALAETPLKVVTAPSVAVVMRSNILRRRLPIGLVKVDTTLNQDMRALVPRDGVDANYVYQALVASSERIRSECVRTDGSMAAVDSTRFFAWRIPLPDLSEQMVIAAKLANFEQLVKDPNDGIRRERTARYKQYEHYRDELFALEESAP